MNKAPNTWVAARMGYSVSGVSLIRSGKRGPTLENMQLIEQTFGWPAKDQLDHLDNYTEALEAKIAEAYSAEQESGK